MKLKCDKLVDVRWPSKPVPSWVHPDEARRRFGWPGPGASSIAQGSSHPKRRRRCRLRSASLRQVALPPHSGGGSRRAFSVLELLVAAGLLVIIMLGLLAMFYQTERAFRLGLAQADILVGGRAALELIVHDLEQMRASDLTNVANFYVDKGYTGPPQVLSTANNETRLNVLQQFHFLTRENLAWRGVRYDFEPAEANSGAATLYRMEIPPVPMSLSVTNDPLAVHDFISKSDYDNTGPLYGRIAEGVVHLALRCYDRSGVLMNSLYQNLPDGVYSFSPGPFYDYSFAYTNLPAFVEVELGILEPKAIARFKATPARNKQAYLAKQAKRVHLFKQRIPIRSSPRAIPNERAAF